MLTTHHPEKTDDGRHKKYQFINRNLRCRQADFGQQHADKKRGTKSKNIENL